MNIVSLCIYTDQCRPLNTFIINKSKNVHYTRKSLTITLIVLVILSNDRSILPSQTHFERWRFKFTNIIKKPNFFLIQNSSEFTLISPRKLYDIDNSYF